MYSFSSTSTMRLNQCHINIIRINTEVIRAVDFSIVTGHRDKETQNKLYPKYSKVQWPDSKHNKQPSLACDVAPYIKPYGALFGSTKQVQSIMSSTGKTKDQVNDMITKAYARLIGHTERVAYNLGIKIRVGLDWDGDWDTLDQKFHDLGHWELVL